MSWTLTKKLAQKRSRAGRWSWARERESWTSFAPVVSQQRSYGHCLNILLFWRRSTAASLVSRVGACFEVSLGFCPPFPTLSHGLPASLDTQQQSLLLSKAFSWSIDNKTPGQFLELQKSSWSLTRLQLSIVDLPVSRPPGLGGWTDCDLCLK